MAEVNERPGTMAARLAIKGVAMLIPELNIQSTSEETSGASLSIAQSDSDDKIVVP